MPSQPQLTVAIPTFNGARHLPEALRSILGQQGVAFDILLCDDRSEDDTIAIARRELGDRIRIEPNPERLGLAGNWNRCAALSSTPLVAIFHQDDVMRPGHLALHRTAFEADRSNRLGFVCGAADVVDDEGFPVPPSVVERGGFGGNDRVFSPGEALPHMVVANPIRCSTVTLRREALEAVGGFDSTYRYVVDWDCWFKIARERPIAWKAAPTVAIRWHTASETHRFRASTTDLEETNRLIEALLERDGHSIPDSESLRQRAHRRLSRAYLNRAYDAQKAGQVDLGRRCLKRAWSLWPPILFEVARDPRLAARVSWLVLSGFGRWHHGQQSPGTEDPGQEAGGRFTSSSGEQRGSPNCEPGRHGSG